MAQLRAALVYAAFLAAFFLLVDGLLGTFAPEANRSFRTAHPYYHHGLQPRRSAETRWGGRPYAMHINSLGFRDSTDADVAPRAERERVVLIGDSMLEGLGVSYEDTVAGILRVRGASRGIEVLNAAVVSYSPKLYELRTRWLVEREGVEMQRLVVFLDISDIHDEILYEDFVPLESSSWRDTWPAWWRAHSLVWRLVGRFGGDPARIDNRFRREADLHVWLNGIDAYRNATGNPDVGRWEWTYDEAAFRAWGERGLGLAESHMAALAAFSREHAIDLVLVVYPTPYQILAKEVESRQVAFWQRFAEREKITFVNLFPAFIDPLQGSPVSVYEHYFIQDDVHWNEAGHAFVAQRVEEAVFAPLAR